MLDDFYPDGIDAMWIASDRNGHLGAFITAGLAPIPYRAFNPDILPFDDIETEVDSLPRISEARLLVSVPRPDSFVALAERGLFVYDWRDIARSVRSEYVDAYEQVAAPTNPIMTTDLPQNIADFVKNLNIPDIAFVDGPKLNVRAYFDCCEGTWPKTG